MTFSELRAKDVINICDGRRLGKPSDIVLNESACAIALVAPGSSSWKCALRGGRDGIEIPWNQIRRIGDDVILVELDANFFQC